MRRAYVSHFESSGALWLAIARHTRHQHARQLNSASKTLGRRASMRIRWRWREYRPDGIYRRMWFDGALCAYYPEGDGADERKCRIQAGIGPTMAHRADFRLSAVP